MVSARIQIIIAVKVSEAVRNNGWDDELRNHVVQRMYKMKDQFTVISDHLIQNARICRYKFCHCLRVKKLGETPEPEKHILPYFVF